MIQLLPKNVANQIAAGEVIQRPASVVKEMLENSLDANANSLKLYIKDSGKTLIQVVDDGSGMNSNDAQMCFERHATSKIKKITDLSKIESMGFRGEAMASIAAISHVELYSKKGKDEIGTKIIIEGGEIKEKNPHNLINGTSIKVKNLFYNVPARRKFLKSNQVEMRHIITEFNRIALANPNIQMELFHNKKNLLHVKPSNLRQRIVNIIGYKGNEKLVPLKEEVDIVKISGFIGKPEFAKRTRGEQYFFVNKRFIKNSYLANAVSRSFEGLILKNYFPSFFINLTIDPKLIDINIHPTKTEIKFQDEKLLYDILKSTIKRSLGRYNIAPSIDFNQEIAFTPNSIEKLNPISEPKININPNYNPFEQQTLSKPKEPSLKTTDSNPLTDKHVLLLDNNDEYHITQIINKYIVVSNKEGIILIHQRRAHKRILFENLAKASNNKAKSQRLLFEQKIELTDIDLGVFNQLSNQLTGLGFMFQIENNKVILTGAPDGCKEENLQKIIESLLEQHKNNEELDLNLQEVILKTLVKHLAIPEIKKLHEKEIRHLYKELFNCEQYSICPSNKPTMINLTINDLEKYF